MAHLPGFLDSVHLNQERLHTRRWALVGNGCFTVSSCYGMLDVVEVPSFAWHYLLGLKAAFEVLVVLFCFGSLQVEDYNY